MSAERGGVGGRTAVAARSSFGRSGESSFGRAPRMASRVETVTFGKISSKHAPATGLGRVTMSEIRGMRTAHANPDGSLAPWGGRRVALRNFTTSSPGANSVREFGGGHTRSFPSPRAASAEFVIGSPRSAQRRMQRRERQQNRVVQSPGSPHNPGQRETQQNRRLPHVAVVGLAGFQKYAREWAQMRQATRTADQSPAQNRETRMKGYAGRRSVRSFENVHNQRRLLHPERYSHDTVHLLTTINRGDSEADHRRVWHTKTASRRSHDFYRRKQYLSDRTGGHDFTQTSNRKRQSVQRNTGGEVLHHYNVQIRREGGRRRWVGSGHNAIANREKMSALVRYRQSDHAYKEQRVKHIHAVLAENRRQSQEIYREAGRRALGQLSNRWREEHTFPVKRASGNPENKPVRRVAQQRQPAQVTAKVANEEAQRMLFQVRRKLKDLQSRWGQPIAIRHADLPTEPSATKQAYTQERQHPLQHLRTKDKPNTKEKKASSSSTAGIELPTGVPHSFELPVLQQRGILSERNSPQPDPHGGTARHYDNPYEEQKHYGLSQTEFAQLAEARRQLEILQRSQVALPVSVREDRKQQIQEHDEGIHIRIMQGSQLWLQQINNFPHLQRVIVHGLVDQQTLQNTYRALEAKEKVKAKLLKHREKLRIQEEKQAKKPANDTSLGLATAAADKRAEVKLSEAEVAEFIRSQPIEAGLTETLEKLSGRTDLSTLQLVALFTKIRVQPQRQEAVHNSPLQLLRNKEETKARTTERSRLDLQPKDGEVPGYVLSAQGMVIREENRDVDPENKIFFINDPETDRATLEAVIGETVAEMAGNEDAAMDQVAERAIPRLQRPEQQSPIVRPENGQASSKYNAEANHDGRLDEIRDEAKRWIIVTWDTLSQFTRNMVSVHKEKPAVKKGKKGRYVTRTDVHRVNPKIQFTPQLV